MSPLESKLREYQLSVGQWIDRQRGYERQAEECEHKANLLRARIAGIQEAMELLAPAAESNQGDASGVNIRHAGVVVPRRRKRSLTGHWQQIMQLVDSAEGFDYDILADAVEAVGHDANRDTLRSQMSIYKAGGLVEAVGEGRFRLTDAGRRAAGISEDSSSNENGAAEAAPDAEEAPTSSTDSREGNLPLG